MQGARLGSRGPAADRESTRAFRRYHLPRPLRQQFAGEVRRVLSPGGRVLVVDFTQAQHTGSILAHFHRHGHVKLQDIEALLDGAELCRVESGAIGISSLQYVLARAPR